MKERLEQSAVLVNVMFSVPIGSFVIVWMWCNNFFLSGTFSSQVEIKAVV